MPSSLAPAAETIRTKVASSRGFPGGFTLLRCLLGQTEFTAAGVIPVEGDMSGMVMTLVGRWDIHPRYGRQFAFTACRIEGGELLFFLTKTVKGIGESTARELIETFGEEELLRILDEEPQQLTRVRGIKEKKLGLITSSWTKFKPLHALMRYLAPFDISSSLVVSIYNHFDDQSLAIVKENPYRLTEIHGVGFKKADEVARKIGIAPHSPFRIDSCIEYLMTKKANDAGDTVVEEADLVAGMLTELNDESAAGTVQVGKDEVLDRLKLGVFAANLVRMSGGYSWCGYFRHERRIVEIVERRSRLPKRPLLQGSALEDFIGEMMLELGVSSFSAEQEKAIRLLASGERTVIVCGYAGTGKSTVSKVFLTMLTRALGKLRLSCMALSGVATDRIRKATGCPAATIHASLGFSGKNFEYNDKKKLPLDVILLDEASMVNSVLFRQLLDAVDDDTCLIMLGDKAQLPPIGSGDVFTDLVESAALPLVELTKIYRQGPNSVLVSFASEIRQGLVPRGYEQQGYRDFQFIDRSIRDYYRLYRTLPEQELELMREQNTAEILEVIKSKAATLAPYISDPIGDFQVLSPMRKTVLGTENLNRVLQQLLNPGSYGGKTLTVAGVLYKPNDKVVHTRNKEMPVLDLQQHPLAGVTSFDAFSHAQRIFNGMVGVVEEVDPELRQVYVKYPPGLLVRYEAIQLNEIVEHAFCMSVHKAQGCEYRYVLLPISSSHSMMLNAKWMYTALTRAKQKVVLVGQNYSFERACRTLRNIRRKTVLAELLAARAV